MTMAVLIVSADDAPAMPIRLFSNPMAGNGYTVGGAAQLTANTYDPTGAPYTPTSMVVTVTDPSGATSTPTVSNPSTGVYTALVPFTLPGAYTYKWSGSGGPQNLQGAAASFMQVNP